MPAYVDPSLPALLAEACKVLGVNALRMAILREVRAAGGTLTTTELIARIPAATRRTLFSHLDELASEGLLLKDSGRSPKTPTTWRIDEEALVSHVNQFLNGLGYPPIS